MEFFSSFGFDTGQWVILGITALTIGLSKTGLFGISTVMFPVMAALFGGKVSAGVVLPMLIMADFFAVAYYRRHAEWEHLLKLLPWSLLGIVLGTLIGQQINDDAFKMTMGIIIILSVAIMLLRERQKEPPIPDFWWFSAMMGVAAGFTSMVGNLAGAVTALYFLSMRLPKNNFIGTGAWFFLVINALKVPFHVFSWETITMDTFSLNLLMFPLIAIGAWLGVRITAYLPDAFYRKFVIWVTLLSATLLFL